MNHPWMQWAYWLGFLMTASAIMHRYFWLRFFRDCQLPARIQRAARWISGAVTILLPCTFLIRRHFVQPLDSYIFLALMLWLSSLYFLVCLRLIAEIVPAGMRLRSFFVGRPVDLERRLFLSRALAAGTLSVGVPALIYGTYKGLEDPEVREIEIKLERLPKFAQGFTIVQLTDMHVSAWTSAAFVERVVERTNALRPDVVAITGDLVDGETGVILPKIKSMGKFQARYGAHFVTGNHEYYVGFSEWLPVLQKLGMTVLCNRGESIAGAIHLAGLPDPTAVRISRTDAPDVRSAVSGRPENLPVVLLAHQPRAVIEASAAGVDLQLSGHTHGGQIWPFGVLVMAAQPYVSGLHQHGPTKIYVSCGTGTWGPPVRIGAPAEITKIVLV